VVEHVWTSGTCTLASRARRTLDASRRSVVSSYDYGPKARTKPERFDIRNPPHYGSGASCESLRPFMCSHATPPGKRLSEGVPLRLVA